MGRAKKEETASDIDQIVSEIGIKYEIVRSHFSKATAGAALTEEDVVKLMHRG